MANLNKFLKYYHMYMDISNCNMRSVFNAKKTSLNSLFTTRRIAILRKVVVYISVLELHVINDKHNVERQLSCLMEFGG